MSKPLFLEQFESAFLKIQQLAAQDARPIPKEVNPDALKVLAGELWADYVRHLGMLREIAVEMGTALEVIRDLQIAKDPDVERLAWDIFKVSHSSRPSRPPEAFEAAQQFMEERNARRKQQQSATAPAPLGARG